MEIRRTYSGEITGSGIDDKVLLWIYFDDIKTQAVKYLRFNEQQRIDLKKECDDLFRSATGCSICAGWYIG